MNERLWDRFLRHAANVMKRPGFDHAEREWKFETAANTRSLVEQSALSAEWVAALDTVFPEKIDFRDVRVTLPNPRQRNWVRRWARMEPASLEEALKAFRSTEAAPHERFSAFATGAEQVPAVVRASDLGILVMGSWFNFALAPDSLPIVQPGPFRMLEKLLVHSVETENGLAESYRHHLEFADYVKARMDEAGVGIRDMVDVQSLIVIAADERDFWAAEITDDETLVRNRRARGQAKAYLSIGAIYRNEAHYLREWLEFHRLVGVERFFLYDNASTDDHLDVVGPYIEDGTVVLKGWPQYPGQVEAYNDCLREYGGDSRWIALLDLDEFLFSPSGVPVSELLVDYEAYPGVAVNWVMFGTSGHRTRPQGLVTETHLQRGAEPWTYIKNIVDPVHVVGCGNVHSCSYDFRTAVDENKIPLGPHRGRTKQTSVSKLRINHYYLKSEVEGRAKLATPKPDGGGPRQDKFESLDRELNQLRDDTILRYVPALHEALARPVSEASA